MIRKRKNRKVLFHATHFMNHKILLRHLQLSFEIKISELFEINTKINNIYI